MPDPHPHYPWWDLFAGIPVTFQILFWFAFCIAVSSFVSVTALVIAGHRHRRRRRRERAATAPGEAGFLWVFLVPALNEEVTIADSVGRLRAAQATNKVILVIDDGSEDATGEILAGMTDPACAS